MAGQKYKFVEDFINPETGAPYDNVDSPKVIKTKFFGKRTLHRIAKIDKEKVVTYEPEPVFGVDGNMISYEEKEVVSYIEKMGEEGGWIENMNNLSQEGDCWVQEDGIVCGYAFVGDDVIIQKRAEVGDYARVLNSATIGGGIGIGDNAIVWGEARVTGESRMAVYGKAHVLGEVTGGATIFGNAHIDERARIEGTAKVYGHAWVLDGTVGENSQVYGDSIVNGTIRGRAVVAGVSFVGDPLWNREIDDAPATAVVNDKAQVLGGVVEGVVTGESVVSDQGRVGVGVTIAGKSRVSQNAWVANGVFSDSEAWGNAAVGTYLRGTAFSHIQAPDTIRKSFFGGNGFLIGYQTRMESTSIENSSVSNGVIARCGVIAGSEINGGLVSCKIIEGSSISGVCGGDVLGSGVSIGDVVKPNSECATDFRGVFVEEGDNEGMVMCPVLATSEDIKKYEEEKGKKEKEKKKNKQRR